MRRFAACGDVNWQLWAGLLQAEILELVTSTEHRLEGYRMIEKCIELIGENIARIVQPTLVPIYASNAKDPTLPDQVGTGFILSHNSRPMLVTAKHTLFGHDGKDEAGEKAFCADGNWVYVGDVNSEVYFAKDRDIACFYADQLAGRPCLEICNISTTPSSPITIGGWLARDFKRPGATLQPKPFIFTGTSEEIADGLLSLQYRRSKVKSINSEMLQTAPIPRGLSGGPMLNSARLALGQVSLVGVFTEQDDGSARGEPSAALKQLLAST